MNPCVVPTPIKDFDGDDRWLCIHNRFLADSRQKEPEVLFIGDCILETLQHTTVWDEYFVPLHSLNFSIYHDRTENVLWRLRNGELDYVKPKIVVLHVGTNNVENTVDEIADGIMEIVRTIRNKLPDVYIVLPTLLPRGHQSNRLRIKNESVNCLIGQKLAGMNRTQIVRIDDGLIQSDGTIDHHDMFDYLNLTPAGCKKCFEPIHDLLQQILSENEPEIDLTPSE